MDNSATNGTHAVKWVVKVQKENSDTVEMQAAGSLEQLHCSTV